MDFLNEYHLAGLFIGISPFILYMRFSQFHVLPSFTKGNSPALIDGSSILQLTADSSIITARMLSTVFVSFMIMQL